MERFKKLKPQKLKRTCNLCGKKREIVTLSPNLIAPLIGAYRWQFTDEDTNKDVSFNLDVF